MQQNKAGGAPPPPLAAASQDKHMLGLEASFGTDNYPTS